MEKGHSLSKRAASQPSCLFPLPLPQPAPLLLFAPSNIPLPRSTAHCLLYTICHTPSPAPLCSIPPRSTLLCSAVLRFVSHPSHFSCFPRFPPLASLAPAPPTS
ncbi:hypothetical protein GQ42DRAFT_44216 [Ramicandelaber brevisporus]|nr:hypothetical protein GQ42DRAFT_44216 [Ramicandelaber brevisporus]